MCSWQLKLLPPILWHATVPFAAATAADAAIDVAEAIATGVSV